MPKKKLTIEHDYSFFLVGISCAEKVYRLCWAFNKLLRVSFQIDNVCEVYEKGTKQQITFPIFSFKDEEIFMDYRIIINKTTDKDGDTQIKYLIPEYKQADYLFMAQGELIPTERNEIIKKIKEVSFIQTVFEINPKKLKSKENLIF